MKMELSDDRIITLVEDVKLPGESFVTTFGDKIFQTNHVNPLLLCAISFGILIFEYKVNLISLIECKVGGSTTDIICACLFFSVLITALCIELLL
jgi:hypothetical protein